MPETVPDARVFSWHDTDEVDTNLIFSNMMFHEIGEDTALHHATFRIRERIEGMGMRLIKAVAYLDKNIEPFLFRDNIDFSSLDRIVHLDYLISLLLEISAGNLLPCISDGTSGWRLFFSHSAE